ncbi:uncharacterized protein LOC123518313 isoform X1 [Portunus trituberculatus]|uniref:uncharacterized protein LOC123518313 isoform X1 n=1 Tax=Portunus trituberculatus TaxID=210409 RepID=UPI001E1CE7F4|nr:uncharacterized protein LOC123518313 isoform X1 [Portunus trituberculatus]XP_045135001.1 uncharacterized protein LOC123518313 isoform X1 [Portunus trituberculatus]
MAILNLTNHSLSSSLACIWVMYFLILLLLLLSLLHLVMLLYLRHPSMTPLHTLHQSLLTTSERSTSLNQRQIYSPSCHPTDPVSLPGEPLGKTDAVQHSIHLTPGLTPTYVPAYRIPHSRRAMVDDAVRAMLQDDVIEPAASPFNAPLFLFPKSDDVPRAQVLRQAAQYGLWCQNYRTGVGTRAIFHTYLIGKFMMSPNYCREREPLLLLPFHGTFHPPMP